MTKRSYEPITDEHLARLAAIAAKDRLRFGQTRPEYRRRHLATILAQGAALHFVNGTNGVKDLAVWSFYSFIPGSRWTADPRDLIGDGAPVAVRSDYLAPSMSACALALSWAEAQPALSCTSNSAETSRACL